jgi:hypothetical protein
MEHSLSSASNSAETRAEFPKDAQTSIAPPLPSVAPPMA